MDTKFTYNDALLEASSHFEGMGLSVIGDGYREICTNQTLVESYIDLLTTNMSADNEAQMRALMENSNTTILRESSVNGITPIASLSMPVIRKLWPRFALKEALKTEVTKVPRFVVAYTEPYMFNVGSDGKTNKKPLLPNGMGALPGSGLDDSAKMKDLAVAVTPQGFAAGTTSETFTFVNTVTNSDDIWPLSKETGLTALVYDDGAAGLDQTFYIDTKKSMMGDNKVLTFTHATKDIEFTVFQDWNLETGAYKVVVVKSGGYTFINDETITFTYKAIVSEEYNEASWSVGFDIGRKDIEIPVGQHINAPLPIEFLNDTMALYNIDGTKEIIDLMTNIVGQKLDKEVLAFIDAEIVNNLGERPYSSSNNQYTNSSHYRFDVRPAIGYAGDPKSWREQLKAQIDHLATSLKNATYLQAGQFVIVGNPLDIQLLTNVDWTFRGSAQSMDGVDVDYSIGTFVGAHSYKVIASPVVDAGKLRIVFLPSSATQMTYKYYPYTFNVEHRYLDPNRPNVPSIMMTKRHTFASFLPAAGQITIVGNDGMLAYQADQVTGQDNAWAA